MKKKVKKKKRQDEFGGAMSSADDDDDDDDSEMDAVTPIRRGAAAPSEDPAELSAWRPGKLARNYYEKIITRGRTTHRVERDGSGKILIRPVLEDYTDTIISQITKLETNIRAKRELKTLAAVADLILSLIHI